MRCSTKGSTSSASASPSCRAARRASAHSCRRRTRPSRSTAPPMRSRAWVAAWARLPAVDRRELCAQRSPSNDHTNARITGMDTMTAVRPSPPSGGTMRALAKLSAGPGLELTEMPLPRIGHNDVMIRIRKTAICGTDIHIWNWDDWARKTIPVPMQVGHEYVGEIVAIGEEVKGFAIGDRVSGEGHITCGYCRNCRAGRRHLCRNTFGVGVNRPGAFAEYLAIPAFNAFKIPDNISGDHAALFDPFGNATHCALAFDVVGEDVLITGAGPIGIMAAAI